ncbi:nucleoside transporter [Salmonella enterica]|uniref:Nucleoside transporter n=3 Tax=Salmonella enterica TaxID=28901 RepID=A0A753VRU8_SALER|nr:nucleoside transporter [Salmonella enterica subsp. enterica serovar Koketime]EAB8209850.1 nucleoside transporter [Salmonella enterica subsp. enterica serovar Lattenkamp]EAM8931423.1 nucleoside transporter [Salmonella enterica]ECJ3922785.1 nucleoside transporter [Salmonella enterica subsp. enterica]EHG3457639.1 nucleoside transporter [Salmonella enterica subsp. enterica serovar Moero]
MKDGVYHVAFNSNRGSVGEGILVLCCGLVNGGDIGFVYQGKLAHPEMTLRITRYYDGIPSVLGIENDYELELLMQYSNETEGQYMLHGYVREYPELTIDACASFLMPMLKSDQV